MVKTDAESSKCFMHKLVILVYHLLVAYSLFLGSDGDRNPMLIATAHKKHRVATGSQITGIHISRQITASQVTNVHRAVGIW